MAPVIPAKYAPQAAKVDNLVGCQLMMRLQNFIKYIINPEPEIIGARSVKVVKLSMAAAVVAFLQVASATPVPLLAAAGPHPTSRFLSNHPDLFATELQSGQWTAASVTGPEVRRFEVTLQQGEFVAVGIKQLGGNLVVAAFDPAGAIVGLEDRSGRGGTEIVTWTAKASGRYAVQVAMFEWDAPQALFEIAVTARAHAGKTPDEIAAQFFDAWHADGYPGAILAVIQHGRIKMQRAAGLATLRPERKIDARTRFDLASVSKQFTGLAVAILAERGLVDLDADIRTYVSEVPDFGAKITVRHLLTHTSGLRDWDAGLGLAGRTVESGVSLNEILAFVSRQRELNFPPGSEQNYSNTNYNLLAAIVARRSGVPFEKFLINEVFGPSGMTAQAVAETAIPIDRMAQSFQGRFPEPESVSLMPTAALGSSSVFASIDDMAAWVVALRKAQNEPERSAWSIFLKGQQPASNAHYAFGLWRGVRNGQRFLGHLGLAAGYRISFRWFPDRDFAVVYMTNDGGDAAYGRAQTIENLFLKFPEPGIELPDAQYTPEAPPPLAAIAPYTGTYRSEELNTAYEIAIAAERLVARHPINGEIALKYQGETAFSSVFPFMPSVRFRRNASGAVDAMIVSTDSARNMIFLKGETAK